MNLYTSSVKNKGRRDDLPQQEKNTRGGPSTVDNLLLPSTNNPHHPQTTRPNPILASPITCTRDGAGSHHNYPSTATCLQLTDLSNNFNPATIFYRLQASTDVISYPKVLVNHVFNQTKFLINSSQDGFPTTLIPSSTLNNKTTKTETEKAVSKEGNSVQLKCLCYLDCVYGLKNWIRCRDDTLVGQIKT